MLLERLDLKKKEPKLWLQTDTTVLSYGREKKGTLKPYLGSQIKRVAELSKMLMWVPQLMYSWH